MITLLLIGLPVLLVTIPLILAIKHAPEGYEDRIGFHRDPRSQAVDPALWTAEQSQKHQHDPLGGANPAMN